MRWYAKPSEADASQKQQQKCNDVLYRNEFALFRDPRQKQLCSKVIVPSRSTVYSQM
jgi:hypothetical protein